MKKRYIDPIKLKMSIEINNICENPKDIEEIIDKEPNADVETVKHSKWNINRGVVWAILHCLNCNEWFQVPNIESDIQSYRRCPNCGAIMDDK